MDGLYASGWLLFLAAAIVLALTPGPGIAYVVARTVVGRRAEGLASCAGTATGGLGHVVAAALGLSFLITRSAQAFSTVQYLGAAYLIYVGVRTLWSGGRTSNHESAESTGALRAFWEGAVVELLNVKTALFFLAFIPQFVDPTAPPLWQFVILGVICVTLNTAADVVAVLSASRLLRSRAGGMLRRKLLSIGSGLTMVGLGLYVAFSRQRS